MSLQPFALSPSVPHVKQMNPDVNRHEYNYNLHSPSPPFPLYYLILAVMIMPLFDSEEAKKNYRQRIYQELEDKKAAVNRQHAEDERIAAAEARADAALKVAENANRINRVLIVITAVVGFLGLIVEFLANMPEILTNLRLLFP